MKTAIVILNFNTRDFLKKWLPGVVSSTLGLDAEVYVVDNGSTDGSVRMLQSDFPTVRVVRLNANYGFTGGYNKTLSDIQADYYVLMNTDVAVSEGWLNPLLDWMETHSDCGICGPKLLQMQDRNMFEYAGAAGGFLDRFGYPYCRGRILSKVEEDRGQYDDNCQVAWVSGACLMIRSSLWKKLGGFDSRFFAHMDEIDLCWRALAAGYRTFIIPSSEVYHLGGGTLPNSSLDKMYLNYRNNLLMLDANLPDECRKYLKIRYALDVLQSIGYFLTFRCAKMKVIIRAHRDYRDLRSGPLPSRRVNVLTDDMVLLLSFKKK